MKNLDDFGVFNAVARSIKNADGDCVKVAMIAEYADGTRFGIVADSLRDVVAKAKVKAIAHYAGAI